MKTIIVIPAYNEEKSIVSTVASLAPTGFDYVVINDGSTDNTGKICAENNINVVNLPVNLGIGGAIQTGFKYAEEYGYDAAIQFDGDGQHEAESIQYLLAGIDKENGGADLVVGSRFVGSASSFKSTLMRRLGIGWLSTIIKLVTGVRVRDTTSGFRVYGPEALKLFAHNYPTDYPEPESLVVAINHGLKISELPATMHARREGTSSIKALSSIYYMIKVTLSIFIVRAAGRRKKK